MANLTVRDYINIYDMEEVCVYFMYQQQNVEEFMDMYPVVVSLTDVPGKLMIYMDRESADLFRSIYSDPGINMYECIIDDGRDVFKTYLPGQSENALKEEWNGNGDFVRIQDVTNDFPIDVRHLHDVLKAGGYGLAEERLICYLVEEFYAGVKL